MCAAWTIAGDNKHDAIAVDMAGSTAVEITQGDTRLRVGANQLSELGDTVFFLAQVYRADVQDAVEFPSSAR